MPFVKLPFFIVYLSQSPTRLHFAISLGIFLFTKETENYVDCETGRVNVTFPMTQQVETLLKPPTMKNIIITFVFTAILVSCNTGDKTKNTNLKSTESETEVIDSVSKEIQEHFKAIDSDEALIATALMAAPKESRKGCKVIGYNMAGEFVTLKEGNNEFICLADNPTQDGFNAACYHKDLEAFMARGRALRSEGKTSKEIFNIREEEVKSGKLVMGKSGSTLHIYYGSDTLYDPETSVVARAQYRYVVYMPWATSESTGLPDVPMAPNHPWIMNPGTHKAHIMFTPLKEDRD